jgi:hypothetical protein
MGVGRHAVTLAEGARIRRRLCFIRLRQRSDEKVIRVTMLE